MDRTSLAVEPVPSTLDAPVDAPVNAPFGAPPEPVRSLIDEYLNRQQCVTAVDRFTQRHDDGAPDRTYRDLIPLGQPGPGQQFAFEVELDACSGCKACVTACHSLNGLDDDESWRKVGLLVGASATVPVLQTVTAACHHCLDPACLGGCPVNAYDKDPVTGIVHHLDDQCIGCGYCVMTCPYDVPVYSQARGIVRKCDMCAGRLAVGEAPACVQACPSQAIRISVVDTKVMRTAAAAGTFLPAAPSPALTVPTTRYTSRRGLATGLVGGDHYRARPAEAHWSLATLLVLSQVAVGSVVASAALRTTSTGAAATAAAAGSVLSVGALLASLAHLGRPRYALRAVLGIGHSWLSREVVALSSFSVLASANAASGLWGPGQANRYLTGASIVAGVATLVCSAMVYAVTGRAWWRLGTTSAKFLGTTVTGGLAMAVVAVLVFPPAIGGPSPAAGLAAGLLLTTTLKLSWEAGIFTHLVFRGVRHLKRTAWLLTHDLRAMTAGRFLAGAVGGLAGPLAMIALLSGQAPTPGSATAGVLIAIGSLLIVGVGEWCERWLFFAAVVPLNMPGGIE